MHKVDYYNEMFKAGKGEGWDNAPGKIIILNAFKDISAQLSKDTIILDVGCGTGYMLNMIQNTIQSNAIKLIGIDISEVAINIAKKRYPDIEFHLGDATHTFFEDKSIDVVISYGTYEHFDVPEDGIKEMARILKPWSVFLLMIPALGHYRKDRTDEGWYEDKTGQPQWNLFRETWELFFRKYKLKLSSVDKSIKHGAKNPGVFFFGNKM